MTAVIVLALIVLGITVILLQLGPRDDLPRRPRSVRRNRRPRKATLLKR